MTTLFIVDRSGVSHEIDAVDGLSFMEVIRDNGFDELLALCGGCCSCATCHVYTDAEYSHALSPVSDDENDLLDSSDHRNESSRLSCQLVVNKSCDGMRVVIAPED